jgi:GDPmannose 4,6-dehydratase
MIKKALVLGVTGQDGSYMAELLLRKNYIVFGMVRKSATGNTVNIEHLINNKKFSKRFRIVKGDLLDMGSIKNIIDFVKPNEIYNFADQDHVGWSYQIPSYSMKTTALAVIDILEILKSKKNKIKYFQPISSNIFGETKKIFQDENTILSPSSIYALGKSTAYLGSKMYNKIFGVHVCGAIFFNHESPRRSIEYVSKKIVSQSCEIFYKKRRKLYLGDVNAKIDWGYAKDYVIAAWKIMQLKKADFFIIGSGKLTTVKSFAKMCFDYLGLDYSNYIVIDKKLIRPSKTSFLKANTAKAKKTFNFKIKTDIKKLVKIMMDSELEKYK